MSPARVAAAALEAGRFASPLTRALARALDPLLAAGLTRPAAVPGHISLICVGGATIGGSGKSRLANACARALADSIVIGHGYRAGDRRARLVSPTESVASAGDEALAAARAGIRVVIGPSRQAAIDFACAHTDTLILDGPLRITKPPPRSLSLLAVDADTPWGSSLALPAGDLRASRATLLALADAVVPVPARDPSFVLPPRPFGLFTALARPGRLIDWLRPDVVVSAPDHGPARGRAFSRSVNVWLATEKCALHLEGFGLPVRIISDSFRFTPTWPALTASDFDE